MYANYGVFTPELNASPILWRVVHQCLGSTRMFHAKLQSMPIINAHIHSYIIQARKEAWPYPVTAVNASPHFGTLIATRRAR
jgi:hypothetical protein